MNRAVLLDLFVHFGFLSLVAVGGANAVVPEMHRHFVDVQHAMTAAEFARWFALAQAMPGPNVLIVGLLGWKLARVTGAVVALVAMCAPSSVLTYFVSRSWDRLKSQEWRRAFQVALVPITTGLVLATGIVLATGSEGLRWKECAVTAAFAAAAMSSRLNPLWNPFRGRLDRSFLVAPAHIDRTLGARAIQSLAFEFARVEIR